MVDVHPNRPPKPEDVESFNEFLAARASSAEREIAIEADAEEQAARARERRLTRLLVWMVLIIVVGSFTVSILFVLITGSNGAAQGL